VAFRPGDVYCLCTDGIFEQVDYRTLAEILGFGAPLPEAADALVKASLAVGGRDNATVALARIGELPQR